MKLIPLILLSFFILSCHEYTDDSEPSDKKQNLSFSLPYNNSDWKLIDSNNNEIKPEPNKYDNVGKIMELDVKLISKKPESKKMYFWYGGSNDNSNGETPVAYNPNALVAVLNLAEMNKEYKVYPPKNNSYKAWSLSGQPIATSVVNNENTLSINLYLEPETYLTVIKRDVYIINNDNSFVEREHKTSYGIYGGMTYGMKFTKEQILRRVTINAHSPSTKKDISFDSGVLSVSTNYK